MTDQTVQPPARKRRRVIAQPPAYRIIGRKDAAILVEGNDPDGRLQRRILPATFTEQENTITPDVFAEGVPYGVPFSDLLTIDVTPASIEDALHAAGLWTLADLEENAEALNAVIKGAIGLTRAKIVEAARQYEKEQEEG